MQSRDEDEYMKETLFSFVLTAWVILMLTACGGGSGANSSVITPGSGDEQGTADSPDSAPDCSCEVDDEHAVVAGGLCAAILRDASGLPIGVQLTWDRQADAAGGYNVYRDTSSMSDGQSDSSKKVNASAIANPGSGASVTWNDIYFGSGLPPAEGSPTWGTTYYYRTTNINDTSDESDVSNELNITIGIDFSISALNPDTESILDAVEIQGNGFGSSEKTGDKVQFRDSATSWIDAAITSWSDTSINVTVPTGAITGHVRVVLENSQNVESASDFTVIAPSIGSVDCGGDNQGQVGDTVTISGTDFESDRSTANGKVFFGGVECASGEYVSWSDTEIQATIPATAPSDGDVTVKTGNNESSAAGFDVLPKITDLSSSNAEIGESITINGTTFGSSQGNSSVTFGGATASVSSWSDTAITAAVPSGISGQASVKVTVKANVDGSPGEETLEGNSVSFNVKPTITSFDDDRKMVSQTLIISGDGFGSIRGTSTVTFDNGTYDDSIVGDSDYLSWSQTSIIVNIPDDAKSGNVFVTVEGVSSDNTPITIILPPPNLLDGEQF